MVKHIRVFGCLVIALDKTERSKFKQNGQEHIIFGYDTQSKAYRLFDRNTRRIVAKRR